MDRRTFLQKALLFGLASGTIASAPRVFSGQTEVAKPVDLVAVKGGMPDKMFDAGIKAFGGMQRFITAGDVVVVKPNIGWNKAPELAANTNPLLVKRIVAHCLEAKAKKVYVFDHTCDFWKLAYKTSGIEAAAKEAGAHVAPAGKENVYADVKIPDAKHIADAKVHELYLEADKIINVPVLKNHGGARLTIAMKNLMGVVWNRRMYHYTDLHQCIADFIRFRKPTLNVVDAWQVMMRNGPRGVSKADLVKKQMQLISPHIVAVDAAATKIFGMEPEEIPYLRIASQQKLGTIDLSQLNIKRITL